MSKWVEATDRHAAARAARHLRPPPRTSTSLPALLPLLVLLGLGLWMWQQMKVPVPNPPSSVPASVPPASSPPQASSPDSREATPQPATNPPTLSEPGSSQDDSSVDAPSGEGAEQVGSTSEAETKAQDGVPPGGESPLDWRPTQPPTVRPAELSDWYHDHDGYISALRRRSHVKRAMILYFRTDWCPWSRRFEDEFLANRAIANWASEQIRVVLNPEAGFEEAELVQRLGITGFPAFFVIPLAGKPIPIPPYPEGDSVSTSTFLSRAKYASTR